MSPIDFLYGLAYTLITMKAILYTRVSTAEQVESGLGLESQVARLRQECEHRGWEVIWEYQDAGFSGGNMNRPAIKDALDNLREGNADVLVVSKLDRLTRSLADAVQIFARADKEGWHLVALDLGVDTTTAAGRLVAHVMAAVAEWERQTISERNTAALGVLKAQGVTLGRPRVLPAEITTFITDKRSHGCSWATIAKFLNIDGIPTAHGGKEWYASTVRAAYLCREKKGSDSYSDELSKMEGLTKNQLECHGILS